VGKNSYVEINRIYPVFKAITKVLFGRLSYPFAVSIDVTYRCNLNCIHCYFLKQGYSSELSKEEWIKKIKELKKSKDIVHCTWVGGEPLLRKDIIKNGKKFFDFNWIVTNGTLEIPTWGSCSFFVSLDGTKKFNDIIRGEGVYDKVRQNILSSNAKIFLTVVLNKINYFCVEEMLKEWANTNVRGINFDFYTPLRKNDRLFIPVDERDKILDKILELKREYEDFILLSKEVITLMRSKNCQKIIGRYCLTRKSVICLDPNGNMKTPCVMGNVDCLRCGCVIPYWIYALLIHKDFETGKITAKLIS
jgi:MoaA/NifB/PqqE/SkfB family radical SAM enzyme